MALFIRYWLTVTLSIPEDFRGIADAAGRDRFASFLQMLGQRLAIGQKIFHEVAADIGGDAPGSMQK
jgi:hypothetical protein